MYIVYVCENEIFDTKEVRNDRDHSAFDGHAVFFLIDRVYRIQRFYLLQLFDFILIPK